MNVDMRWKKNKLCMSEQTGEPTCKTNYDNFIWLYTQYKVFIVKIVLYCLQNTNNMLNFDNLKLGGSYFYQWNY